MSGAAQRPYWRAGAALLFALPQLTGVGIREARADEGGAGVWLPGQFASFAAVPGDPGPSLELLYYHPAGRTFPIGAADADGHARCLVAVAELEDRGR
jgi:hypothetical protein